VPADPRLIALGTAIREARNDADLSQEALAAEAEVDRSYFGHIERGLQNPSYLVLRRIADGLGIPFTELVERAVRLDG